MLNRLLKSPSEKNFSFQNENKILSEFKKRSVKIKGHIYV